MQYAPVGAEDAAYLVDRVIPTLQPLTDEDYMHGPAVILHTLARYSYILLGDDVYWCVEWDPGLIVISLSPDGRLAWTAVRSPIPNFGGRTPSPQDLDDDELAENHTYNLVFRAWDAQFDEEYRKCDKYKRAPESVVALHGAALEHVSSLGDVLQAKCSQKDAYQEWAEVCKRNLTAWAGEGHRLG